MIDSPLEYHWLHVKSGSKGLRAFGTRYYMHGITESLTYFDKLRLVNNWNRLGKGEWIYWME